MPDYILTAKSPHGATVTETLNASSADEAVLTMHERGYSEIQLHTDDVGALYAKPSQVPNITPSEFLQFRNWSAWKSFLFVTRKLYLHGWKTYIFFVAIILVRRWLNLPWNWIDYANLGILLFPMFWAAIAQFVPSSTRTYDKVLEATSWGRWQEVLELLPSLQGKGVPPEELAFRRAQAVAGQGRLPEALEIVQPYSDGKRMPEWLYWGRLGDIYEIAGQPLKLIPCTERAAELAAENATVLVDLAMALLKNRTDLPRVKRLLDQIRSHALSDLVIPFVRTLEGLIALEENDNRRAKELFSDAFQQIRVYVSANGLIGAVVDRLHAYLAIVESRLGNSDAARKHFQQAQPRLQALRSFDLLQRCSDELRIPL